MPRVRKSTGPELGTSGLGIFPPGPWNAITDVEGVLVGQVTVIEGARVNTGVTAIRPHPGSIYHERVPAAIYVGNGFGKLLGVTQVRELGELEMPIPVRSAGKAESGRAVASFPRAWVVLRSASWSNRTSEGS